MSIHLCSALLLACLGLANVHAGALLESSTKLAPLVRAAPEILLVDARSEKSRRQQLVEDATPYQKNMTVKPGLIVVVGDNNQQAMQVARRLVSHGDQTVYAVKGGAAAWLEMKNRKTLQSMMPNNFVIPHNTCEQGSALQVYKK